MCIRDRVNLLRDSQGGKYMPFMSAAAIKTNTQFATMEAHIVRMLNLMRTMVQLQMMSSGIGMNSADVYKRQGKLRRNSRKNFLYLFTKYNVRNGSNFESRRLLIEEAVIF